MAIEYQITLDDGKELYYCIEMERPYGVSSQVALPKWTELECNRCSNCPLQSELFSHCPVAVDLHQVIEDVRGLPSFAKAQVWVRTPEREYTKVAGLEEAVRSLIGVIMATSNCPLSGKLKPMAYNHLPFASSQEFTLRAVSVYLTRQYFNMREGRAADWELKGLVAMFKELQLVNQAFWQRIHGTCEGDPSLKAFLSFFSMSTSMTHSLETQLQKIRPLVMSSGD